MEEVKSFLYLGYVLTKNNKDKEHVKCQAAKTKALLGKIWSLGKKLFKTDSKERMNIFNVLVRSVAFYGVEIWGWKKYDCLEIIQKKYIKWVLELDRNTPDYVIRRETKRGRLVDETRRRAEKYEENIQLLDFNDTRKDTWERKYLFRECNRYIVI